MHVNNDFHGATHTSLSPLLDTHITPHISQSPLFERIRWQWKDEHLKFEQLSSAPTREDARLSTIYNVTLAEQSSSGVINVV